MAAGRAAPVTEMAMLVRIFMGATWAAAREQGDYVFDIPPAVGDKLAIALTDAWTVAVVRDVAHRITDPQEAADMAILISDALKGGHPSDPLPLRELDAASAAHDAPPATRPAAAAPRTPGPWGG